MLRRLLSLLMIGLLLVSLGGLTACESEGLLQQAEEKINEATGTSENGEEDEDDDEDEDDK